MTVISAAMVKELRERSGQAVMDCKNALNEANGDIEGAIELLRKKGKAVMAKRGQRETKEGKIVGKISADGKAASMVMLCSETDFTAKNDEFSAASETIADALLNAQSVPENTNALFELGIQGGRKVADALNDIISKTGEKIAIGDFARFDLNGSGLLHYYLHFTGKNGTLLQLEAESDDAASREELKTLAGDLAMHITAYDPQALSRDQIDPGLVDKEREIAASQIKNKPPNIMEKIIEGKLNKWFGQTVLLEQPFVKDDSKSVQQVVDEVSKEIGSKIGLKRFTRLQVG